MRTLAHPVVGYVGAVLAVIAVASIAVFNLRGMTAKAQRHWDTGVDRIIAQQREKKRDLDTALARAEIPGVVSDAGPQIAALTRNPVEEEEFAVSSHKSQIGKKSNRRAERQRQHYIPTIFAIVPNFAATAAATTTSLFRLR